MAGNARQVLTSNSPQETVKAGKRLGILLKAGDVVALTGELGAGKTVFTKGIAAGLGFEDSDSVTSPTYKILNRYEGRVIINHLDAYRLAGPGDFSDIGGDDLLGGDAVCIIEWAQRIKTVLPSHTVSVDIQVLSAAARKLELVIPEKRRDLAELFRDSVT